MVTTIPNVLPGSTNTHLHLNAQYITLRLRKHSQPADQIMFDQANIQTHV